MKRVLFLVLSVFLICLIVPFASFNETQSQSIKVNDIVISKGNMYMKEGQVETVSAQVFPYNATNQNVNFFSSNDKIVSVDNEGNVKANSKGEAKINAISEDGLYADSCNVLVVEESKYVPEQINSISEFYEKAERVNNENNLDVYYVNTSAIDEDVDTDFLIDENSKNYCILLSNKEMSDEEIIKEIEDTNKRIEEMKILHEKQMDFFNEINKKFDEIFKSTMFPY